MTRLAVTMMLALLAAAPAGGADTAKPAVEKPGAAKPGATKTASAKPDSTTPAPATSSAAKKDGEDGMTMRGGQEGTVFRSLTVEGEDRVRIDFERPTLRVDLDPSKAPGLDWGSARDVLDHTLPDLTGPLLARSAFEASPYVARPWLSHFATGAVVRFRPEVKGVERWKLTIVDARGEAVATYSGRGEPPREIAWDGKSKAGTPVVPGLTYSNVFEAHDKAGNKRNFVGRGFSVSAYRLDGVDGPTMVMSAQELPPVTLGRASGGGTATPSIILEAASWLNQVPQSSRPVRVTATAPTHDQAQALADQIVRWMVPHLLGDPARVQAVAVAAADAPQGGTITIAAAR